MTVIAADDDAAVEVAPYLCVQPADVAGTRRLHGRALCYQIELVDGRRFFVKKARSRRDGPPLEIADSRLDPVRREARTVRALQPIPMLADISAALVAFDDPEGVAVYRGYQHWSGLDALQRRPRGLDPLTAAGIGAALARLHAVRPGQHPATAALHPTGTLGRSTTDWVTVTPASLAAFPSGYRELWARMAAARDPLDGLFGGWRATNLVHGDIKSDNIFVSPDDPSQVLVVDWETAGWGDPYWDVGNLVGDLVSSWLNSMTLAPGGTLQSWLASAALPLSDLRRQVRSLLDGYAPGGLPDHDQRRVIAYAGCYLLQRALASATQADRLDARTMLIATLASQFLAHPDQASEVLL